MERVEIKINDEFRTFLRPLSTEEEVELEKQLMSDGCRDPLTGWRQTSELVDGHHRYGICTRNNIQFRTIWMDFADKDQALDWIADRHIGRRNLSAAEVAYLIGREYRRKVTGQGGDTKSKENVADKIAEKSSVSPATVTNNAKFSSAVDKLAAFNAEAKKSLLSGEVSQKDALEIAKLPEETVKMVADNLAAGVKIEAIKETLPPAPPPKPKSGKPKFDDRIIPNLIGKLTRALVDRARVHNRTKEYLECEKAMEALYEKWTLWLKATT